jgi:hypothetical protein
MFLQPTEISGYRREKQAMPENGSTTSRTYRAKIEISTNDCYVVLPEVAIALYDL